MSLLATHSNELIFAASTLAGMVGHYVKKSFKGETECNLKDWFGAQHLPGSVASLGTSLMVIIGALSNGVITPEMAFWPVVYIGLTTGYAIDSTANSDGIKTPNNSLVGVEKV
jgi:hypothetical protein